MKLHYWLTIAAASALWVPVFVSSQGMHGTQGWSPFTMPHNSVNQPARVGGFLPHFDPALPNRRVPSLTPPQPGDIHPVTPDEAWPMPLPSIKPEPRSLKPNAGKITNGEALSGKGRLRIKGPLEGLSGADSPLGR